MRSAIRLLDELEGSDDAVVPRAKEETCTISFLILSKPAQNVSVQAEPMLIFGPITR